MLTPQDVSAAYQLLLGRAPESDAIIENYVRHASFDSLRRTIIESGEFLRRAVAEPNFFAAHPCIVAHSARFRLTLRQLEHLASLDLPVFGRNVFCTNLGIGLVPSFFLDRYCEVAVSVIDSGLSEDAATVLKSIEQSSPSGSAEVYNMELGKPLQAETPRSWNVVVCSDVALSAYGIQQCMTNLSSICSDLLILDIAVAAGSGEFLVKLPKGANDGASEIALPTRDWVWSQLSRRFAHVYVPRMQPCHEIYAVSGNERLATASTGRAMFVASRSQLDEAKLSPILVENPGLEAHAV